MALFCPPKKIPPGANHVRSLGLFCLFMHERPLRLDWTAWCGANINSQTEGKWGWIGSSMQYPTTNMSFCSGAICHERFLWTNEELAESCLVALNTFRQQTTNTHSCQQNNRRTVLQTISRFLLFAFLCILNISMEYLPTDRLGTKSLLLKSETCNVTRFSGKRQKFVKAVQRPPQIILLSAGQM